MPKHTKLKMKMKARGAMARGGVPSAGVGSTVGQWVEDWLLGWLGFADGGSVHAMARGGLARGGMARGGHSVFH